MHGADGLFGTGGFMLSANDMFFLDKKSYAYVGERMTRGLGGDLFTSTRDDIPDISTNGLENYEKSVLEYYFAQVSCEYYLMLARSRIASHPRSSSWIISFR